MSMLYIRAAADAALAAETKGGAALVNVLCALADNATLPDAPQGMAFQNKPSDSVPFNVKAFGRYRAKPDAMRGFAVWSALNIMASADRAALLRLDATSQALIAARNGNIAPLLDYLESEARAHDAIGNDGGAARIRSDAARVSNGANDAPAIAESYMETAARAVRDSKKANNKEARRRILYRAWSAGLNVWRTYSESVRNAFESATTPAERRDAIAAWLQGEAGGVSLADAERLTARKPDDAEPPLSGDLQALKRACDALDRVKSEHWQILGEYAALRAQAAETTDIEKKTDLLNRAAGRRAKMFSTGADEALTMENVF